MSAETGTSGSRPRSTEATRISIRRAPAPIGAIVLAALCAVLLAPAAFAKKPPKPISLTVNTTADGLGTLHGKRLCGKKPGQCTLRAAVEEADKEKAGSTVLIHVKAGTYTLSLGVLAITANTVTIEGAGAATTTVSAGGSAQVLSAAAGTHVTVAAITLTEGVGGAVPGGGFENGGSARVLDAVISKSSGAEGGGIYNAPGAMLELQESTVTENFGSEGYFHGEEFEEGGNGGNGGGIANAGTLLVVGGTISANYAGTGARSRENPGGNGGLGGAIFNSGTATLTGATVSGNYGGYGGLGYNEPSGNGGGGGGLYNEGGTVNVAGGSFASNQAGGAGTEIEANEADQAGGGGAIDNARGIVHVMGVAFSSNVGGAGRYGSGGEGGAIANADRLSVEGSTFTANRAGSGGYGGTGGDGGAIYNSGTATLTTSTLDANQTGPGGESLPGGSGAGIANTGTLEVSASTLADNVPGPGGAGGARDPGPGAPGGSGGSAGAVLNSGTLRMFNSTIYGNRFGEGGAGGPDNGVHGGPGTTGGIMNTGGTATLHFLTIASNAGDLSAAGTVKLEGTIVAASTAGPNCVGTIGEEGGYNLDSGISCGLALPTDRSSAEPGLGPLAASGGPTQTLALLPGSPAIDAGGTSASGCPAVDQRGVTRPDAGETVCDIGAYESQGLG